MGNLESRTTLSPIQFAFLLLIMGIGVGVLITPQLVVPVAKQQAWISVVLGGSLFFLISMLIIRLGDLYPGETMVEYLPRIWGRPVALAILIVFVITTFMQSALRVQNFAREIGFFMFDRTPLEVIILSFLVVCVYGAVQDLGTIIRIAFWMFFLSVPLLVGILFLSLINIHIINFYPLWPIKLEGVLEGVPNLWQAYWGYEILLIMLPMIGRQTTNLTMAVAGAFLFKALIMLLAFVATVGGLTVEGVINTAFPTLITVRGIELPGTFVERLDNYLLLSWIPIGYITIAVWLHVLATLTKQYFGFHDHRPFVLFFGVMLFISSMALHDLTVFSTVLEFNRWLGFGFSIVLIPMTYIVAKWKRGKANAKAK